jgi:tetratricopeptide (TPR) repeat protein
MGEIFTPVVPKPSEKVFEEEDSYILFGLRAEEIKAYIAASKIFTTLYEKSNKKEYLYRSLQNDLASKKNKKVVARVDEILDENFDDYILIRLKIMALIGLNQYELAKDNALKLVTLSNEVNDYILVSNIYVKQQKFDTAIKYLESAYTQNYNEKILDKMSIILYVNLQRKKDAIAQLETHSRIHGCSKIICVRLIGFYSNENNIDGLLSTYLRFYNLNHNPEISKKIVQIYSYKQEHIKLMDFLEDTQSDNKTLLELYITLKNYKKAYPLAAKLYVKTQEINYLGQSAIFEYESSENKDDTDMQMRVVKKLKKLVNKKEMPLYLNYLGYLLIEHDLDVKLGIEYVKKALDVNPNSAYYLDSLAWGYYKLGMCTKADTLIQTILKLKGGDEAEVLEHAKMIKKCIKYKKGEKKK